MDSGVTFQQLFTMTWQASTRWRHLALGPAALSACHACLWFNDCMLHPEIQIATSAPKCYLSIFIYQRFVTHAYAYQLFLLLHLYIYITYIMCFGKSTSPMENIRHMDMWNWAKLKHKHRRYPQVKKKHDNHSIMLRIYLGTASTSWRMCVSKCVQGNGCTRKGEPSEWYWFLELWQCIYAIWIQCVLWYLR